MGLQQLFRRDIGLDGNLPELRKGRDLVLENFR
jgi:hypothetical protein